MELRVIDFEILTRNFKTYVDGYKEMDAEKRNMLDKIEPQRKEIEDIIRRSQSGLIVDERTQKRDIERFKELQEILMKADVEYKKILKEMTEELNTKVYDQLSEIVSEWASNNSINLVMGKMEVIFNTSDIDATEQIIEVLKEKGLYYKEIIVGEVN